LFGLNAELIHSVAELGTRETEELCGMNLITTRNRQRFHDQVAYHRSNRYAGAGNLQQVTVSDAIAVGCARSGLAIGRR
jgi:hypothetical protein